MEHNQNYLLRRVAELSNITSMMLYLLTAVIALSVGLGFFFLVAGPAGYGVGIAMFVVASLLFVIGEIQFFAKMAKLKAE